MQKLPGLLVCVWLLTGAEGTVKLTEDAPTIPPPKPGDVTGRISSTDGRKVLLLKAICRATQKTYQPAKFDSETGRFVFKNLPGDANYDIRVQVGGGRIVEGIDLSYVDARLLRMAARRRRQLSLAPERRHKFGPDDVEEIRKYVADLKDFMDIRRILYIRGHGRRATMLIELMRARDFYARKANQLIWRIELWYFEYQFGGWERLANVERVLERRRIPSEIWRKISIEYYPPLSVYVDRAGRSRPIEFKIPPKADPSRGRVAGTEVPIRTRPHVSGLDVKPTTTTAPGSSVTDY